MLMLELNEVLLEGEPNTFSMMAHEGRVTCITGGTPQRRTQWLLAMMGLRPVKSGFISLDGEPLTAKTAPMLRKMMAYVPDTLDVGTVVNVYEPPTVQQVFALKANRGLPISNGLLAEETRRTGATGEKAQWLAVAMLLKRSIVLIDSPLGSTANYLRIQAEKGLAIVVATTDGDILSMADNIYELTE